MKHQTNIFQAIKKP